MSLVGSTLLQSMPAELTAGVAARQVKPDRERIRSILNMGSVIELQRQLLTTVMENEVSESQPTRKPIRRFSQVEREGAGVTPREMRSSMELHHSLEVSRRHFRT